MLLRPFLPEQGAPTASATGLAAARGIEYPRPNWRLNHASYPCAPFPISCPSSTSSLSHVVLTGRDLDCLDWAAMLSAFAFAAEDPAFVVAFARPWPFSAAVATAPKTPAERAAMLPGMEADTELALEIAEEVLAFAVPPEAGLAPDNEPAVRLTAAAKAVPDPDDHASSAAPGCRPTHMGRWGTRTVDTIAATASGHCPRCPTLPTVSPTTA